jgi:hypothetical protein
MLSTLFCIALVLPVLLYVCYLLPVEVFILPSMRLEPSDRPHMFMSPDSMLTYTGVKPTPFIMDGMPVPLTFQIGPLHYLLIISADESFNLTAANNGDESNPTAVALLTEWYTTNEKFFQEALNEYGGVLFRNFNLKSAEDFDQIIGNLIIYRGVYANERSTSHAHIYIYIY